MAQDDNIRQLSQVREMKKADSIAVQVDEESKDRDLLHVEVSERGTVHATSRDRFQHEFVVALAEEFGKAGVYRRDGGLVELRTRTSVDFGNIPLSTMLGAAGSLTYGIKRVTETVGKTGAPKKLISFQAGVPDNLASILGQLDMKRVGSALLSNSLVKELVFANEFQKEDVGRFVFVPPTSVAAPATEAEIEAKAHADKTFAEWVDFMREHCPEQLDFFNRIAFGHMHAAQIGNGYTRLINVGVGPNSSGKGSFIRFLETIPGFAPARIFGISDTASEYRHDMVFNRRASLIGCHEWRFERDGKIDQFISMMKSSTRREPINVRRVGSAAAPLVCHAEFFLFFNSSKDTDRDASLRDAYRKFSTWDAYDRISITFINWVTIASEKRPSLFAELNRAVDNASDYFGMAVRAYVKALRPEDLKAQFIPKEFRTERAEAKCAPWEAALVGASMVAAEAIVSVTTHDDDGVPPNTEAQAATAKAATETMCKILGIGTPETPYVVERKGRWACFIPSSELQHAMERLGASRKWVSHLPEELEGVFVSGRAAGNSRIGGVYCHALVPGPEEAALLCDRA